MGRIRLRVRDIDYPESKQEVDRDIKSQKSWSPRSRGNKTGVSSRHGNDSQIDINDIDISQKGDYKIEGMVGLDGGIELAPENLDVQTMKNKKTFSQKSNKGTKSENC
jgi:hypothetical protein